jgi:polyisoprenoid-binding protein YceI
MILFRTLAALAVPLALVACSQPPPAEPPAPVAVRISAPSGQYALDKNHTSVIARVNHFGLSHYTVRFTSPDATLEFNADTPTDSSLIANVDVRSIETDYPGDGDFDADLQNSEWLDAANNPLMIFRSTALELTSPTTGRMTGDLTIRGITKPAVFDVTFNNGYAQHPARPQIAALGFSARGVFKRSDYGLMVLQPPAGTFTGVSDEVEVLIEAEFTRALDTDPSASASPAPAPAP